MKRSKRGSMQLSIEAIIILVIAIVLLGLGIAFVKNFFGEGAGALGKSFDPIKEQCQTTADNPILPLEFKLKPGEKIVEKICVYNNIGKKINSATVQFTGCQPALTIPASVAMPVDRDRMAGYKMPLTVPSTTTQGTVFICNIQAGSGTDIIGPAQAVITVE